MFTIVYFNTQKLGILHTQRISVFCMILKIHNDYTPKLLVLYSTELMCFSNVGKEFLYILHMIFRLNLKAWQAVAILLHTSN